MCDLWKNTTPFPVPDGAVAGQIRQAMRELPPLRHVKLYNSGSFFDAQAIPRRDWPAIAAMLRNFRTVIVESHPRLVNKAGLMFARMIPGELQVAMGLETVDPIVLPRLNKHMTLDDFDHSTRLLAAHGIPVRAFILLRTPFQSESEGVLWAKRSIEWAFSRGVECCVVIPTRGGNGAMERLADLGHFTPPTLESLCEVLEYGISLRRGRVFADLWDIHLFVHGSAHAPTLIDRLRQMNLNQEPSEAPQDSPGTTPSL